MTPCARPTPPADSDTAAIPASAGPVAAMFGRIAPGYDCANRFLSAGLDIWWRKKLVNSVRDALMVMRPQLFAAGVNIGDNAGPIPCRVLDLAAGTLDVSLALLETTPFITVLAADFCLPMLQAGRAKLHTRPESSRRRFLALGGNAFALPLPDNSVDAVTVAFGLRNMQPRTPALAEMARVLRPGGSLHVLEFGSAGRPLWGGLYNLYLTRVLPCIGGMLAGDRAAYSYLARTITDFPDAEALGREMRDAGFTGIRWKRLCGGIVLLHLAEK